ncbi:Dynein light chain 1 [Diplonema papillatum]|nr:Dynein light chain 1 [Diplonema papillatum]
MYDLNELEELDAAELELQHEHIMADVKKYEDEEADWRKRPQSKHKKGTRISSMLIAEHCLDVDTRQKGEDAVIKAVLSLKEVTLLRLDIVDLSNLDCMMQLQRLSLPFNRISKIDDLDLLSNLTTLILSHNQIRVIENLEALASLQVLDLSYNAIARLPSDLSQVLPASLTELDLRENPLLLDENDRTEEPEAFGYRQQVVADVAGLEMLDGVRVAVEDRHKLRPRADSHGVPPRPAPSAKPGGGAGDFDAEMRKIRAACEEEGLSTAGLPTLAEQRVAAMSTLQKAFEPPPSAAPAAASSAGGGYFAKPRTPAMDPGEDDSDFTDAPAPSHVDTRRQQLLDRFPLDLSVYSWERKGKAGENA